MIRLVVAGATGQTGGAAFAMAGQDQAFELLGGIAENVDDGRIAPIFPAPAAVPSADVMVDFTTASASPALISDAAAHGIAVVSGTTGLTVEQEEIVTEAAKTIPIVRSGNFSLGVNLLLSLVEEAAAKLENYDIEITEAHHRRKVDAPSGTALMLGEAAAQGIGSSLQEGGVFARHGQTGARKDGEIGFSVIRGGGIKGDHTVAFFAEDEVVQISHRALDRSLFARGALTAAKWVHGKAPGLYTMRHVLGLD